MLVTTSSLSPSIVITVISYYLFSATVGRSAHDVSSVTAGCAHDLWEASGTLQWRSPCVSDAELGVAGQSASSRPVLSPSLGAFLQAATEHSWVWCFWMQGTFLEATGHFLQGHACGD